MAWVSCWTFRHLTLPEPLSYASATENLAENQNVQLSVSFYFFFLFWFLFCFKALKHVRLE